MSFRPRQRGTLSHPQLIRWEGVVEDMDQDRPISPGFRSSRSNGLNWAIHSGHSVPSIQKCPCRYLGNWRIRASLFISQQQQRPLDIVVIHTTSSLRGTPKGSCVHRMEDTCSVTCRSPVPWLTPAFPPRNRSVPSSGRPSPLPRAVDSPHREHHNAR